MKQMRTTLLVLLCSSLLLASGCAPAGLPDELQVAVIVALTQTAAALEASPAQETATPVEAPPTGGYQPLPAEECRSLQEAMAQAVGIPGELNSPVPFEDYIKSTSGSGCEIRFSVVGLDSVTTPATAGLKVLGWQENQAYAAGGVGGYVSAYENGDALCLFTSLVEAADENACPSGQGYIQCMGELKPDELRHSVILNCARWIE
jgi:hypothetical protein